MAKISQGDDLIVESFKNTEYVGTQILEIWLSTDAKGMKLDDLSSIITFTFATWENR